MQVLATYTGKVRDFRAWLAAGMPANVVCLEMHRKKKKTVSAKTATGKKSSQISTSSIPDGVA